MTDPLTTDRLDELERLRAIAAAALDRACELRTRDAERDHENANLVYFAEMQLAAPKLIAAARERARLVSALEFLNDESACVMKALLSLDPEANTGNVTADGVVAFAQRLGWRDPMAAGSEAQGG